MAIEQANVVDAIGIDRLTGETVLTVADALSWDAVEQHLTLLSDKLEAYHSFVASGSLFSQYPKARGRPTRVDVVFRFEPPIAAANLIGTVGRAWAAVPLPVAWRVHPGG